MLDVLFVCLFVIVETKKNEIIIKIGDFRHFFWKNIIFSSVFKTLNLKNSLKLSFSGFGSIKKRFLMVKSCLEHISKLILIGKKHTNINHNFDVP